MIRKQCIYFARCVASNGADMEAIKIGCSWGAVRRLKAVASKVPFDCDLICTAPGTMFHEAAVHMLLRDHQITGEYFRTSPAVLDFVDKVSRTGRLPMRIRQSAGEDAWIDMDGTRAFMALHGITAEDAAAVSGSKAASYRAHIDKDGHPNRRFAAALTVAAIERGALVRWPTDFIAPLKTEVAA